MESTAVQRAAGIARPAVGVPAVLFFCFDGEIRTDAQSTTSANHRLTQRVTNARLRDARKITGGGRNQPSPSVRPLADTSRRAAALQRK